MQKSILPVFLVAALQLCSLFASAQFKYIVPDSSFGTNGVVINNAAGAYSETIHSMDAQPDGKIVVAGKTGNAGAQATIIRFMSDGSLDTTFGIGGYSYLPYNSTLGNGAGGVKVLTSGKIVANGSNDSSAFIVRLTHDGTIDSSFGTNGFFVFLNRQFCRCPGPLVVLQDGSIISEYEQGNGPYNPVLVKIDGNGVIDNSFGTSGQLVISEIISNGKVILDNSNRILVSGKTSFTGMGVVRILASGSHDNTFGSAGLATVADSGFATNSTPVVLSDNSIVLLADNAAPSLVIAATHLMSNGSQDMSYGTGGLAYTAFRLANPVYGVALDNDEVFMLGTYFYQGTTTIITGELSVLNVAGKVDSVLDGGQDYAQFQYDTGTGSRITTSATMHILPGGKVMVGGENSSRIWLARYNYRGFATGTNEVDPSIAFHLFPNPANGVTMLTFQPIKNEATLKVFDLTGKTVFEKNLNASADNYTLETSTLCNGLYFVQLRTGLQNSTAKLVVAH